MTEHSPTPWFVGEPNAQNPECESPSGIRSVDDYVIADICGDGRYPDHDATFIVRAVNCHEELVRELEDCELSLKLDVDEWGSPRLKGTLANIRAALAKAKELSEK